MDLVSTPRNSRGVRIASEASTIINLEDNTFRKRSGQDIFLENTESKERPVQLSTQASRFNRVFASIQNGDGIKTITIPGYHISNGVVFYEVVVTNSRLRWNIWVRFDSFTILHLLLSELARELGEVGGRSQLPPIPAKHLKVLIDHFSQEFVENRRGLLENYLQKVNKNRTLRHAEDFIHFLLPPKDFRPIPALGTRANPHPMDWSDEDVKISEESPTRVLNLLDSGDSQMLFLSKKDEVTGVEIKSATLEQVTGAYAIYSIRVWNVNKQNDNLHRWIVTKRFMDFVQFDKQLRESLLQTHPTSVFKLPHLPPKLIKSWTDHKHSMFIEKRRVLLQVYLRRLIRYPLYRRHQLTLAFLGVKTRSASIGTIRSPSLGSRVRSASMGTTRSGSMGIGATRTGSMGKTWEI